MKDQSDRKPAVAGKLPCSTSVGVAGAAKLPLTLSNEKPYMHGKSQHDCY